jgi:hypothetical protein
MKTIRTTACVFGIVLLAAVMSAPGSRVAAYAAIDPEVLVAREAAWRAFCDGAVKALSDVRMMFPETQAQRFGDVVVLYGRFEVVFQSGGADRTRRGRLTEIFVRRDGKWLHLGWHLDVTAGPAPSQS